MVGRRGSTTVITLLVHPASLQVGAELEVEEEERHHLRVRRVAGGERVRLLDGEGGVAQGVLGVGEERVRVEELWRVEPPSPLRILVGGGDRDRFGWLVEKAAELGVTDLVPLVTEHSRSVGGRVQGGHVARLQRRAREAIKQSGAAWAPRVHPPVSLEAALAAIPSPVGWLADVSGSAPLAGGAPGPTWVAVGPEGGFTPGERALVLQAGAVPIRLGPHVMRFETAAVAAAVVARVYQRGGVHE